LKALSTESKLKAGKMKQAMEPREAIRYVEAAKALKKGRRFYDIHVHPHDIIFNLLVYRRCARHQGLYAAHQADYAPPALGRLPLCAPRAAKAMSDEWRAKIFTMTLPARYGHTGPRVFGDQMALCGIDEVLLLPVAGPSGPFLEEMSSLFRMFSEDERFHLAGSIPADVPIGGVSRYVQKMVALFGIRAVKIHPNISAINVSTSRAKEWLEAVLFACGAHGLPLILHVGRNAVLPQMERARYADIDHFDGIDWSVSGAPVVFAHAGVYGFEQDEIRDRILPKLIRLLEIHGNLRVDIADLRFDVLRQILVAVDPGRILFGSDALYTSQWSMMVTLLAALSDLFPAQKAEEGFVAIMSDNPQKVLFFGIGSLHGAGASAQR
jgi:predicted TIM-barrel fold metal-dependent hydrolase